jgi:hypothetical protein
MARGEIGAHMMENVGQHMSVMSSKISELNKLVQSISKFSYTVFVEEPTESKDVYPATFVGGVGLILTVWLSRSLEGFYCLGFSSAVTNDASDVRRNFEIRISSGHKVVSVIPYARFCNDGHIYKDGEWNGMVRTKGAWSKTSFDVAIPSKSFHREDVGIEINCEVIINSD